MKSFKDFPDKYTSTVKTIVCTSKQINRDTEIVHFHHKVKAYVFLLVKVKSYYIKFKAVLNVYDIFRVYFLIVKTEQA